MEAGNPIPFPRIHRCAANAAPRGKRCSKFKKTNLKNNHTKNPTEAAKKELKEMMIDDEHYASVKEAAKKELKADGALVPETEVK
ncbi:MAG: hypothetical protein QXQ60_08700 [Thermofilum sp.]